MPVESVVFPTCNPLRSPERSHRPKPTTTAGAATLYLELYDSVSGEILARAIDRKAANHPGDLMRWSNKVTNRAEAKRVLAGWAGLLRQRLDEIHGKKTE